MIRMSLLGLFGIAISLPVNLGYAQSSYQLSGTYTNAIYLYSIGYDALQHYVQPGWDESHFFLRKHPDQVVAFAEVIEIGDTGLEAEAVQQALNGCDSDGPDISCWCERRDTIVAFHSTEGLQVLKFYLMYFCSRTGGRDSNAIGPFYAVDISRVGSRLGLLIKHSEPATHDMEDLLRQMVDSVKLISLKH